MLYIQVDSLDEVIPKLTSVEVVVPPRKTFYGAHEMAVREPAGNVVSFALFAQK